MNTRTTFQPKKNNTAIRNMCFTTGVCGSRVCIQPALRYTQAAVQGWMHWPHREMLVEPPHKAHTHRNCSRLKTQRFEHVYYLRRCLHGTLSLLEHRIGYYKAKTYASAKTLNLDFCYVLDFLYVFHVYLSKHICRDSR